MKTIFFSLIAGVLVLSASALQAQQTRWTLDLKSPGNPAVSHALTIAPDGTLKAEAELPLGIVRTQRDDGAVSQVEVVLTAEQPVYFSFEELTDTGLPHGDCQFFMPGFWYRRNLRSPDRAPSMHTSDSWQVREDRLSTPLTGIYNEITGKFHTVLRTDKLDKETLAVHTGGQVLLGEPTSLGYTGFRNCDGRACLVYGFPYHEAPRTYIRKLTLAPEVQTFHKLEAGESITLTWELRRGTTRDFSDFVADVWNYSFDRFTPQPLETGYTPDKAKSVLSNFYKESYIDRYDLKYYSGIHLRTDDCLPNGQTEVGFIGRVLLNAYNALEYGGSKGCEDMADNARAIFDSYLAHGFTTNGFFREYVNMDKGTEPDVYSIRRQSEGAYAVLSYLHYERLEGRSHPEWEDKIERLLGNFLRLQNPDGSFPRKFDDAFRIVDSTGGSTPSATLPLAMAYKYFGDKKYLVAAKSTGDYLEENIISKADYFSSTLDANCEDKEASLYAATAMYYLSFVTKGKERQHYAELCRQSAYFTLSWYYMWDVPFAPGQMLGDVGFKSRGWGNVSVENNHIDVFIFEFATILDWLAGEFGEERFSAFSSVIKSSMLQLMPAPGNMFDIARVGYYPEVVQHTNWDYGKNGKGFYNDIFAPGWTVASLWQMLCPERAEDFFSDKKR